MSSSEPLRTKAEVAAALAAVRGLIVVEPTLPGDVSDVNVSGDHRSLADGAVTFGREADAHIERAQERGKGK
ncbi:MAG: hypothetical protein HOV66_13670 [Streptomycetaceae bacterium]|jgi:hypothetical protein|nr:hypothetical protein [Streptomycetaceae bacterium]